MSAEGHSGHWPANAGCPLLRPLWSFSEERGFPQAVFFGLEELEVGAGADMLYCPKPFTVAWRSVLLPARCFTRTISLGSHHLTSLNRDDLNASQDVARRSTSAINSVRASSLRSMNAAPA